MNDYGVHNAHIRIVVRANPQSENEQAWLMCSDCSAILCRLTVCGQRTKRGGVCRHATTSTNGCHTHALKATP